MKEKPVDNERVTMREVNVISLALWQDSELVGVDHATCRCNRVCLFGGGNNYCSQVRSQNPEIDLRPIQGVWIKCLLQISDCINELGTRKLKNALKDN